MCLADWHAGPICDRPSLTISDTRGKRMLEVDKSCFHNGGSGKRLAVMIQEV